MIPLDLSGGTNVIDVPRGGVVCTAVRKMLALGLDPADEIDVRRHGQPGFDRCKSVGWWAARTVVEDGEQGPRIRLLRPTEPPHSDDSALRVSDHPENEAPAYGPSAQEVV